MLDKLGNDVYIWYSGATDVTGKNLAAKLGIKGGNEMPKDRVKMVIGWGTKTKDTVTFAKDIHILNHPNTIKLNRDKPLMLGVLQKAGIPIAPFCKLADDIGKTVKLPVIARKRFHQGGKGFWLCPTMTHVKAAIDEGAEYFQNMIEIKEEYRIHVFDNEAIYCAKKTRRTKEEMEEAFVRQELEKMETVAKKKGEAFDKATTEKVLCQQAKRFASDGANMLIRSNNLGWKFVKTKTPKMDSPLIAESIKALKASGLCFGAVDCCIDVKDKPYIIEINSGPGLEESTFDAYIKAMETKILALLTPKPSMIKEAVKGVTDRIKGTIGEMKTGNKPVEKSPGKAELINQLTMAKNMVEVADDEEATVLRSVFKKMFG